MTTPAPILLTAALAAADRGWHVFPVVPGGKRPAFPDHSADRCTGRDPRCRAAGGHVGWEARATTDPDRIRRAWSAVPYNVGIACGPSRLVVVDLDTPKRGRRVKVTGNLYRPAVPPAAVYVGRQAPALAGSPWHNPHPVGKPCPTCTGQVHDLAQALNAYRAHLQQRGDLLDRARTELAGRDLACWCPPEQPCHADILLDAIAEHTTPEQWRIDGVHDGGDVLAVLAERHSQPLPVDTHTVATCSGGTHLYYQHPAGPQLRNTAGTLGWLVDTRAHGGYVLAAGSTVAGRPYTTRWHADPAPLPEWLTTLLTPAPAPPARPVVVDLPTDRRGAYLRAAINRQVAYVTAAASGRNHALYLAAQNLGQLVAGGALPRDHVEAVLTQAAMAVGLHHDPPAGQIPRTIASGLRAGAARPRSVAA